MLIQFETTSGPLTGPSKEIYEWVLKNNAPMDKIEGYEPHSMADDLTNVIFRINNKFYGPIRQSYMPDRLWIPLSRKMVELKNAKKKTTKTELYHSDQYMSRCILCDPQDVTRTVPLLRRK